MLSDQIEGLKESVHEINNNTCRTVIEKTPLLTFFNITYCRAYEPEKQVLGFLESISKYTPHIYLGFMIEDLDISTLLNPETYMRKIDYQADFFGALILTRNYGHAMCITICDNQYVLVDDNMIYPLSNNELTTKVYRHNLGTKWNIEELFHVFLFYKKKI